MKFRKKPVEIEALRWNGHNRNEIGDFMGVRMPRVVNRKMQIQTLEGVIWATEGDWIIKGVQGEFYPCRADIFDQTYEKV